MPEIPPQTDTFLQALDIFDRSHPLRVDPDENLKVTLVGGSGGTVDQGTPNTLGNGWPVKITDGTNVLGTSFNPLVVTSSSTAGMPVNQYAENTAVPSSTLTPIVSYTVPVGKTLLIQGFVGWGQFNGEFLVQVNGVSVGGGWSTPSNITLPISYAAAPITANAGQVVTVNVTHYAASTQDFKANLLGVLQ